MKSFVVVFTFCIIGAFAGITDEQKAKLKEHKLACIAETGVDHAVLENIKKGGEVPVDEKLDCFSACVLKKGGIMMPDGSINEEAARSKFPQDLPKEKADEIINSCKDQVGKDSCETGGKVLRCLKNMKVFSNLH